MENHLDYRPAKEIAHLLFSPEFINQQYLPLNSPT